MEVHVKRKSRRRRRKNKILWVLMICTGISAIAICAAKFIGKRQDRITPEEVLLKYMGYIQEQNYTAMYQLIDVEASGQVSEEDFVKCNSAIYEGWKYKIWLLQLFPVTWKHPPGIPLCHSAIKKKEM